MRRWWRSRTCLAREQLTFLGASGLSVGSHGSIPVLFIAFSMLTVVFVAGAVVAYVAAPHRDEILRRDRNRTLPSATDQGHPLEVLSLS
jgi:heme O synthase-like polyprenyltransferase